ELVVKLRETPSQARSAWTVDLILEAAAQGLEARGEEAASDDETSLRGRGKKPASSLTLRLRPGIVLELAHKTSEAPHGDARTVRGSGAHDRVHPMAAEHALGPVGPPDQLAHPHDANAAHPGERARPGRHHHARPAGLAPRRSRAAR